MLEIPKQFKVIPTKYKGCYFRSRLEARWAVFFDSLNLEWEYEKEGFEFEDGTKYLPDFWLPQLQSWAEVKYELTKNDMNKIKLLSTATTYPVLLLIGKDLYANKNHSGPEYYHKDNYKRHEPTGRELLLTSDLWNDFLTINNRQDCMFDALDKARSAKFEWGKNGES